MHHSWFALCGRYMKDHEHRVHRILILSDATIGNFSSRALWNPHNVNQEAHDANAPIALHSTHMGPLLVNIVEHYRSDEFNRVIATFSVSSTSYNSPINLVNERIWTRENLLKKKVTIIVARFLGLTLGRYINSEVFDSF